MAKKLTREQFKRAAICFECGHIPSKEKLKEIIANPETLDVLKYWTDQFGIAPEDAIVVEALESKEELHFVASHFNWDGNTESLSAIVDHPLCDAGTGLLLYWLGQGYYYLVKNLNSEYDQQLHGLFQKIVDKFLSNDFATYQIAFDPYAENLVPQLSEVLEEGYQFPPTFFAPYSTMQMECDTDKYPKEYWD